MPDYPIVIHEQLSSYRRTFSARAGAEALVLGWKLSLVAEDMLQLTVHEMDRREGFNRLCVPSIMHRNIPLETLFLLDSATYRTNNLDGLRPVITSRHGSVYLSLTEIVKDPEWLHAWISAKQLIQQDTTLCADCGFPETLHNEDYAHAQCHGIGDGRTLPTNYLELAHYNNSEDWIHFCSVCINQYTLVDLMAQQRIYTCSICYEYWDNTEEMQLNLSPTSRRVCESCVESLIWCDEQEHYTTSDDGRWDESGDYWICDECYSESHNPTGFIHEWNYRPHLVFHPDIPTNPTHPLYIGLELEVSWPSWSRNNKEAYDWLNRVNEDYEELLYVKSDSSVSEGFEVVTHPMEPSWALEHFPFDFFQEAIDNGALPTHESCGTHIHIDKASLTTAQMWKLLQLHHNMPEFCQTVGGRGSTTYADWNLTTNIKKNQKQIAQEKGRAFGEMARYVPVNVRNEQTLELRYMAGGIEPDIIRKNIEWVQAIYNYTKETTISQVKQGVLDQQNYLLGYALSGPYPTLAKYLQSRMLMPLAMPERTN